MCYTVEMQLDTKRLIRHKWDTTEVQPSSFAYMTLRPWQTEFVDLSHKTRHVILNAFMGAGKGLAMRTALVEHLGKETDLKAVIAVPMLDIAEDFREGAMYLQNGDPFDWSIYNDFCGASNTTEGLTNYLREHHADDVMDRVAICSHQTLVRAFDTNPELFENIIVIIDEAHHSQSSEEESNRIGEIVRYGLNNDEENNISLWLATATFFRGDQMSVVPTTHYERFAKYDLPFDKYLGQLSYLKSFNYDFIPYQAVWTKVLRGFFKDRGIGRALVQIPVTNHSASTGHKLEDDYRNVLIAISNSNSPKTRPGKINGTEELWVNRLQVWVPVINLVDENTRDIGAVNYYHNLDTPPEHLIVIAMNMMKEGSNLKWLDRAIILGGRGSLNGVIQTSGRVFRDAPGKEHAEVIHFIPDLLQPQGDQKEAVDAYLTQILLAMLMVADLFPMASLGANTNNEAKGGSSGGTNRNLLKELYPDISEREEFLENCVNMIIRESLYDRELMSKEEAYERFTELVDQITEISAEDSQELAKQMLRFFEHQSKMSSTVEGMDLVDEIDGFEFVDSLLTSNARGRMDLENIRETWINRYKLYQAFGEWKTILGWSKDERCEVSRSQLHRGLMGGELINDNIEKLLLRKTRRSELSLDTFRSIVIEHLGENPTRRLYIDNFDLLPPDMPKAVQKWVEKQNSSWGVLFGGREEKSELRAKKYPGFGEMKSLRGWSRDERCSLSPSQLSKLSKKEGFNIEVECAKPKKDGFTALGKTYETLREWSDDSICVVSYSDLLRRIYSNNWDLERALTTPKRGT